MSIQPFERKPLIIEDDDEEETLTNFIKPYKNGEYIPSKIINKLLKLAFNSCEILHEYNINHKIIKVKIDDLLKANIKNWKYNRPADLTRCYDIARYIYISKSKVDTMLYLSYNNQNETFDVIDGIHRYNSLKIIQTENSKPHDYIVALPNDFGGNNDAKWLFDSYIIINIRINSSEGELIELFRSLNKSNPIPDLYIRDTKQDKRDIIEALANNWQIKYKSHFSANNKPYKPNINRDRFIDLLEIIYDKHNITNENKHLLEDILQKTNTNILFNIPKKLPNSIAEKCCNTGLWLFIYSIEELVKMI